MAQGIIDRGRHTVEMTDEYEDVRASKVELGRTVKFEVHKELYGLIKKFRVNRA